MQAEGKHLRVGWGISESGPLVGSDVFGVDADGIRDYHVGHSEYLKTDSQQDWELLESHRNQTGVSVISLLFSSFYYGGTHFRSISPLFCLEVRGVHL
jgi:hypothetical protein